MFALLFIENQIPKVTGTLRINATVNQPVELFAEMMLDIPIFKKTTNKNLENKYT
jgi:hypothetical protein